MKTIFINKRDFNHIGKEDSIIFVHLSYWKNVFFIVLEKYTNSKSLFVYKKIGPKILRNEFSFTKI